MQHEYSYSKLLEIEKLVENPSFYICDTAVLHRNFLRFKNTIQSTYPNLGIGYSFKTNYLPYYCKMVNQWGGLAEVVSPMEYELALKLKISPKEIIYNGPIKSKDTIFYALTNDSYLNIDSLEELQIIQDFANTYPNKKIKIGLRCNFLLPNEKISRFGIDIGDESFKQALDTINEIRNCTLSGLHFHYSSQERSIESYKFRLTKLLEISKNLIPNFEPEYLDIGGGFFGDMSEELKSLFPYEVPTIEDYSTAIANQMNGFFPTHKTKLIIEPGVALVANTMTFFAKVNNIKCINGKYFASCNASFQTIKPSGNLKNLPIKIFLSDSTKKYYENLDFVGYTCLEYDRFYTNYCGFLNNKSFIAFENMGSYNIVFKPPFIEPSPPIITFEQGGIAILRRKETTEDIFNSFIF
ncbi:MAG: hypothetical protein R2798_04875 [Chitinophagales bacterium]|nr:decarboxylase [Chitinophagales bacterium]